MLAAFILPLSTAYAVCEAFGFERGISKSQEEAPVFFGLYTALIVMGAGLVLWPNVSLYQIMLTSQVVNGVLLPPILIFMVLIANDKTIMGNYANSPWYSVISWVFTYVLITLTILLVISTLLPDFMDILMNLFGI